MGEVYTVPEMAEKLKCNIDIIRKKLREGVLKGKRQRGEWLISEENFLEYTNGIANPIPVKDFATLVRKCEKSIRDKVDPDGKYIKTVWGVGYKFVKVY